MRCFMLTIWVFKAFVDVRIDTVRTGRIGHLVSECEEVLSNLQSVDSPKRSIDIFIFPSDGNKYLTKLYVSLFKKIPSSRVFRAKSVHSLLALLGTTVRLRYFANRESQNYCGPRINGGQYHIQQPLRSDVALRIPANDMQCARDLLQTIGFPTDLPIICVHVRDGAYLPNAHYHDYRDPPLETYTDLIRYLLNEGFAVIRTGSVSQRRVDVNHPSFLDYPFSSIQSDEMDVLMYALCSFAVAGNLSGLSLIAIALRKPLVVCDLRPLFVPTYSRGLCRFIPSRMQWTRSGIALTLAEMVDHRVFETDLLSTAGIKFIPRAFQTKILTLKRKLIEDLCYAYTR